MKEINTRAVRDGAVQVPGSKSYTHRMLIGAALSDGVSRVENPLRSEDTLLTAEGLRQLGVAIDDHGRHMTVHGCAGRIAPAKSDIYLGNSGTSVRLLTGLCAAGQGRYVITGTPRMQERPVQDLLDGLTQLGVSAVSVRGNGCPPVAVTGARLVGGTVCLDCHVSSQYLSSLLLTAPLSEKGITVTVVRGPVSKPYVDMTLEVMARFGIRTERDGYARFFVPGGQTYRAGCHAVEPDASQAGYFWAAAAVTGRSVTVKGLSFSSRQGDVKFAEVFGRMGCAVTESKEGISVSGGALTGITVDMADMPDMVPTLAVVAAFARGETVITNVGHLKAKESDRLGSVVRELQKMGVAASCTDTGMTILGGGAHGAAIDTYDDHRMAMSFAVAGLRVPGIHIKDPGCVAKSFPDFWEVFDSL